MKEELRVANKKKSSGEEFPDKLGKGFDRISDAIKSGKSAREIKSIIDSQGHSGATWLLMKTQILLAFGSQGREILRLIKRMESVKSRANRNLR